MRRVMRVRAGKALIVQVAWSDEGCISAAHPILVIHCEPVDDLITLLFFLTLLFCVQCRGRALANAAVGMGTTKPVSIHWPTIVSYFNSGVGVFQGLFTLSTLVAQFEVNQDVLKGNQLESDNADIYAPFISYYFLLQNTLMTYSGDHFDAAPFVNALEQGLGVANTGDTSAGDQVRAYFPGESMISLNSPAVTGGPAAADSLKAYQYYSAIVNKNKDPFTNDRHWGFELTVPDMIPPFRMQYGIMSVTIDLALQIGFVLASDGGSTYGANGGLESARDIKKLGWSAIDVTSFGLDLLAGLYIEARIDFGFFSETFVISADE